MSDANDISSISLRRRVVEAEARIRPWIRETPLEPSYALGERASGKVWLKLENLQWTGSFKVRGAANALLSLSESERGAGIITASSGNHATAIAHLLRKTRVPGRIYIPAGVADAKVARLDELGAHVIVHGTDCVDAEQEARRVAETEGLPFISPYNDPLIVAGQGTVAVELERQLDELDAVLVPVGGGGLISGIAGYLKAANPQIRIIGCQPVASAVMSESIQAGRILDLESSPTLSDGTAGGIEAGSITFDICRQLVDDWILLDEEEIRSAIRFALERHQLLIEGAAALSVAAYLNRFEQLAQLRTVLVLSGCRLGLDTLRAVIAKEDPCRTS